MLTTRTRLNAGCGVRICGALIAPLPYRPRLQRSVPPQKADPCNDGDEPPVNGGISKVVRWTFDIQIIEVVILYQCNTNIFSLCCID